MVDEKVDHFYICRYCSTRNRYANSYRCDCGRMDSFQQFHYQIVPLEKLIAEAVTRQKRIQKKCMSDSVLPVAELTAMEESLLHIETTVIRTLEQLEPSSEIAELRDNQQKCCTLVRLQKLRNVIDVNDTEFDTKLKQVQDALENPIQVQIVE